MIRDEIDQALGPVELVAQSVVLTGGAAQLRGAVDLARDRFRLPVRLGKPRGINGLSDIVSGPEYACAVGMVLYGIGQDGKVPASVLVDAHQSQPQQSAAPQPAGRTAAPQSAAVPTAPNSSVVITSSPAPVVSEPVSKPAPKPVKEQAKDKGKQPSFGDRLKTMFKDWF